MSDQDNPVTAQDSQIEVMIDGNLMLTGDLVSFTASPTYDEHTSRPIGATDSKPFYDLTGWEGEMEFEVTRGTLDDIIDLVNSARKTRQSVRIDITESTIYRDGTGHRYSYPFVQLRFNKRVSSNQKTTITVPWKTGRDRRRVV